MFATYLADDNTANIFLTPIEQAVFCKMDKKNVYPVLNKWGENGATTFDQNKIDKEILQGALFSAYKEVMESKQKGWQIYSYYKAVNYKNKLTVTMRIPSCDYISNDSLLTLKPAANIRIEARLAGCWSNRKKSTCIDSLPPYWFKRKNEWQKGVNFAGISNVLHQGVKCICHNGALHYYPIQ